MQEMLNIDANNPKAITILSPAGEVPEGWKKLMRVARLLRSGDRSLRKSDQIRQTKQYRKTGIRS